MPIGLCQWAHSNWNSFILAQLLAGHFDGIQPELKICRHLWALGRFGVSFEQFADVALGDALLGEGDGADEAIGQCDELLLQVDGLVVPPDELRLDLVWMEDGYGAAIAHTAGSLDGAAAALTHQLIEIGQRIEMEAGKVQLAQIARIVHVPQEDVHVLGGAQAVDGCGVRHLALALEQPAGEHRENAAYKVVNIPNDVQNEQHHQQRHGLWIYTRTRKQRADENNSLEAKVSH